MKKTSRSGLAILALVVLLLNSSIALAQPSAQTAPNPYSRVLLISIDGFHAVDLELFIASHPNSALTQLAFSGVTFTNASTATPSDSFPGLLAIVTGGSPRSTGIYYDSSYDRNLSPAGSNCSTKGAEVEYAENVDKNPDALDGGGGIDEAQLPRDPANGCAPVYPHSFLRVNTIFEVIKAGGGRTAWSDKHLAYEMVNGPSGQGVDDLFNPEINAGGVTGSIAKTEAYDDIKVQAILNEIDGKDHTGTQTAPVPTVFGMNFQAVSVGQKLAGNGYKDATGTPSDSLKEAMEHTDASIGKMIGKLRDNNLLDSTLVIITAKHGQSPIDITKRQAIKGSVVENLVNGVAPKLLAHATLDDAGYIWLTDQSKTADVVAVLNDPKNRAAAGIQEVWSGELLKLQFPDPATDSRPPDIIIHAIPGVIYTSGSKIAEHGGFTHDDTSVPILLSNSKMSSGIINKLPVQTMQIAPTILKALGLDPQALQAVQQEGTPLLPGF